MPLLSLEAKEDHKASIMVFDASGSMWGKLKEGQTKIDVAKKIISGYLKDRDQNTPLGIIAYGHNRKGDCSDIEVIAPLGEKNINALTKTINQIKPKGKTPLTASLELAVKQIPLTAEEADIILITDGLETCDRDPCALAQKIADMGINIRAHVVGFGLSEKEVDHLSCITKKTGGKLLRPQSGKELADALKQVEQAKSTPTEPVVLEIRIGIREEEGTARPTEVNYSAKNVKTNEIIELGKTVDAKEVLQGIKAKLPKGKWLLLAKGPRGTGELEISAKQGEEYSIPYHAQKANFVLKNYGPYQLGQSQSFLLELGKSMQKNLTLTAMLVPEDFKDGQKRIDWVFLIGEEKGLRELNLKSPKQAGKYKIVITPRGLKKQIASFNIEYVEEAKSHIKIPENIKPKEKFSYELYGNWYRNNSLQIMLNGKKISSTWLQYTIEKEGLYLTAPEEEGSYEILLHHKNSSGKYITTKLADLQVETSVQSSNTLKESKSSLLYDMDKLVDELIFTCKQTSCTYDDKETKLKAIPLLKNWAIEKPYYYTTAAGIKADIPTITFVHTKTGAWFILNPRQATDAMFNCIEFGKEGRLSIGEKVCSPKEIPDALFANMGILLENIEFWRVKAINLQP